MSRLLASRLLRGVAMGALLVLGTTLAVTPASARVFIGFGFGPFFGYYPPAYPYPYAAYPYAYPYPYAPAYPPAYPPAYSSSGTAAAQPGQDCREYRSTQTINGRPQQVLGTACRQPDGTWRMMN